MTRGKEVFAESCAACHSSKQPPANVDPRSGEGKAWFRAAVMEPDFLKDNFLSNEKRYPIDEDRDELGARVRDKCEGRPRLGQFLLAHIQRALAGGRAGIFQPV